MSELFTIHCEYAGGSYISQFYADNNEQALLKWAAMLREEQPIKAVSCDIANAIESKDEDLGVPLDGLIGAWCRSDIIADQLLLVNIFHMTKPT